MDRITNNKSCFVFIGKICTIIKYSASIALKCQIDNMFHLNFNIKTLNLVMLVPSVGGIAVSIAAFQAVDPGSTPGHRNYFLGKYVKFITPITG